MTSKIKVHIVDDDPFIRESLQLLLGLGGEIEITGTAANGAELIQQLEAGQRPDVVLMDIRMPVCDGVEGTRRIKEAFPDMQVLILTTFDDDDFIIEALQNGASGYLLKNIPPDRIMQGIKSVHAGNMLIHPDIGRKLASMLRPAEAAPPPKPYESRFAQAGLTESEQQIVALIADGLSNKEIAGKLFLSEGTVKNYITEILSKLEVRDRTQIAILYWKEHHKQQGNAL
ncbi:DNA-binding response regulator [Paenibacillus sp. CAA11]|nr:DNA-binding response regulator [Paenibacillus sp. CAA11]